MMMIMMILMIMMMMMIIIMARNTFSCHDVMCSWIYWCRATYVCSTLINHITRSGTFLQQWTRSLYYHWYIVIGSETEWGSSHWHLYDWSRVTHICVGKLIILGSDNGLSPGRRQAIIWTNAGILLIELSGTNFSEILIGIQTLSFKEMHFKMSSEKWHPICLGLNVFKSRDNSSQWYDMSGEYLISLTNVPFSYQGPLLLHWMNLDLRMAK